MQEIIVKNLEIFQFNPGKAANVPVDF